MKISCECGTIVQGNFRKADKKQLGKEVQKYMNTKQISDTQRNNRTALTGHTVEALIIVIFYISRFVKGERTLAYAVMITALALIPVLLGQFFFLRDKETTMIKHTVGIGFAVTYTAMVLTTQQANIYVLVIPMILLVTIFDDVKYSIEINTGTIILSLIMTIGGARTGRFGYQGADGAIVQVTAMVLVAVYSVYAAMTSNANSQRKLDNVQEAQSKTEKLLADLSSMSQQIQAGMEDIYEKVDNLNNSSLLTKDAMIEVSGGTAETADAVQNQMAQTGEIQSKVNIVSDAAEKISKNMEETLNVLGHANKEVDVLVMQVENSVKEGVDAAGKLETLDQYIEEMHSIVELISGITSQTSLLALNASIEAQRAGEAGRGFSVVAKEITGMAARTKEATVHIRQLIENISDAITDVVTVVREMIAAINEERQSTENTAENFAQIQSNTLEIKKNIEQLNTNIEELKTANEQIVESIETISAITEEVSAHANETMTAQEQNSNVLNKITARMQQLIEIARQEA